MYTTYRQIGMTMSGLMFSTFILQATILDLKLFIRFYIVRFLSVTKILYI